MKPRSTLLSGAFLYLSLLGSMAVMEYHLQESFNLFS